VDQTAKLSFELAAEMRPASKFWHVYWHVTEPAISVLHKESDVIIYNNEEPIQHHYFIAVFGKFPLTICTSTYL